VSVFRKRTLLSTLHDVFLRSLEQGRERTALDALAAIGATQGVDPLHDVLVATASVGLQEQLRRAGLDPSRHEWAVAPPVGSPYTIDELPVGPRTAVRWLAAVGNGQHDTARALFDVLDSPEYGHDDRELFLQTVVRSLREAWTPPGRCPHGPH
jgi:hypothetical protein